MSSITSQDFQTQAHSLRSNDDDKVRIHLPKSKPQRLQATRESLERKDIADLKSRWPKAKSKREKQAFFGAALTAYEASTQRRFLAKQAKDGKTRPDIFEAKSLAECARDERYLRDKETGDLTAFHNFLVKSVGVDAEEARKLFLDWRRQSVLYAFQAHEVCIRVLPTQRKGEDPRPAGGMAHDTEHLTNPGRLSLFPATQIGNDSPIRHYSQSAWWNKSGVLFVRDARTPASFAYGKHDFGSDGMKGTLGSKAYIEAARDTKDEESIVALNLEHKIAGFHGQISSKGAYQAKAAEIWLRVRNAKYDKSTKYALREFLKVQNLDPLDEKEITDENLAKYRTAINTEKLSENQKTLFGEALTKLQKRNPAQRKAYFAKTVREQAPKYSLGLVPRNEQLLWVNNLSSYAGVYVRASSEGVEQAGEIRTHLESLTGLPVPMFLYDSRHGKLHPVDDLKGLQVETDDLARDIQAGVPFDVLCARYSTLPEEDIFDLVLARKGLSDDLLATVTQPRQLIMMLEAIDEKTQITKPLEAWLIRMLGNVEPVKVKAASVVYGLTCASAVKETFRDMPDLLRALARVLKTGSKQVKEYAIAAVCNLAGHSDHRIKESLEDTEGLFAALVDVLRTGSEKAKEYAATAVYHLANGPRSKTKLCTTKDLLAALTDVLKTGSETTKECAAAAIFNLAVRSSAEVAELLLTTNGVLVALVDVLRTGSAVATVHASGAIFHLANNDRVITAALYATDGLLPALVSILRTGSREAIGYAVQTISIFANNGGSDTQLALCDTDDLLPALANILSIGSEDSTPFARYIFRGLWEAPLSDHVLLREALTLAASPQAMALLVELDPARALAPQAPAPQAPAPQAPAPQDLASLESAPQAERCCVIS
jgi:hypothetical protein